MLGFDDPDDTPSDSFQSLTVTAISDANSALEYNGSQLAINDVVTATDLTNQVLVIDPIVNTS
jgi:hypothetical protein